MSFRGTIFGLVVILVVAGPGSLQAGYSTAISNPIADNGTDTTIGGALSLMPQATTTLYSNVATFSGQGYANGGASTVSGLGDTTKAAYDDITTASGSAGAAVTSLTFSVANFNSTAVSADVIISIYSVGLTGLPGTLIDALLFNPISFTASSVGR